MKQKKIGLSGSNKYRGDLAAIEAGPLRVCGAAYQEPTGTLSANEKVMSDQTAIEPTAAIAWLEEAARYFETRDAHGEDSAHWSNVYNAETARKIAGLVRRKTRQ